MILYKTWFSMTDRLEMSLDYELNDILIDAAEKGWRHVSTQLTGGDETVVVLFGFEVPDGTRVERPDADTVRWARGLD